MRRKRRSSSTPQRSGGRAKNQPAGEPRSLGARSARSRRPGGAPPQRKRGDVCSAAGGAGAGQGGRLRTLWGRRRRARGGASRSRGESRRASLSRDLGADRAEFAVGPLSRALRFGGRGVGPRRLLVSKSPDGAGRRGGRPRRVLARIGGRGPEALAVGVALREIVGGGASLCRRPHRAARQERHRQDDRCDLLGAHRRPRPGRTHAGTWTGRRRGRCKAG